MAGSSIHFSVDSYVGFALGDNRVWVNPAVDTSEIPEYLLHEIAHCVLDRMKHEGRLVFAKKDEEYVVNQLAKSGAQGLKKFFRRPRLRKAILARIQAARKRLGTKERWR